METAHRGVDYAKGRDIIMLELIRQFIAAHSRVDETGATAVEYGLMVALIAAVIIGTVATLGGEVQNAFQVVVTALP